MEEFIYDCKHCGSIAHGDNPISKCAACGKTNKDKSMKEIGSSIREAVLSYMQHKEYGEATELLVQEISKNNHIYTTKVDRASEMFIYKEGIYLPEGESEIKSQLRVIMDSNYSDWLGNQVLAKIKTDTGISSEELFKEHDEWLLPVENGIIDLKNIELLEFTPDKIFFSKIPIKYEEGLTPDKIDQFLTDVLAKPEDKDVFYELAGFGLVKEYIYEKAFMFVGNGRNGKGKTIELLKRLVGTRNCASVPLTSLTSDGIFVQKLWRRHFNLAGDLSTRQLKETGMFKQLTGRDPISANRKYKDIIEFINYAKMVFACNELPKVYDYSDGFWDRWVLLEFPYKFVNQNVYNSAREEERENWKIKNPNIINEITTPEELSGFLNMAIVGLHRLTKQKGFSYTVGTHEVKNKWIRKSDSFMAFAMDFLEEDFDGKISKRELRKTYKNYCTKHRVGSSSDREIRTTLQEMFGVDEVYSTIFPNTNQENCWTGIKFKENGGNFDKV